MSTTHVLGRLAHTLGQSSDAGHHWAAIAETCQQLFDYGLLTGLVYLQQEKLMRRIYSSNEAISPLGGFKATGKGPWSDRVLDQGLPYIGRDEADIRTVFSEAEDLVARGLHAVLNIPVWYGGEVLGSINILGPRGAYNDVPEALIHLVAGVCVPALTSARESAREAAHGIDSASLQSV